MACQHEEQPHRLFFQNQHFINGETEDQWKGGGVTYHSLTGKLG